MTEGVVRMAKLDRILKSKSFYVIISVLLGIITWLLVQNYTNPTETRTLEIPLTILNPNSPSSLELSDQTPSFPETVTVKASGRSEIIGNLSVSDFYTAVDFADIVSPGKTTLEVSRPTCSRLGVRISDYYPKTVDMNFDKVTQRNVEVVVENDNSLLREGYEFISVTPEPGTVQISGFASEINEIECIRVRLSDVLAEGSIDSDRTGSYIGRYILSSGEDVTANYSTEKITVKIQVAKRVPVAYELTGNPHDDFYVNEDSVSPETVMLRGDWAAIRNIDQINVGKVDITGASQSVTADFGLSDLLPAGVTSYDASHITVSAVISEYEVRSVNVNVNSSISTPGKNTALYVYTFSPEGFSVRVKGKAEDLDRISASSLGATLDLTDLGVGEYRIPLEFTGTDSTKFTVIGEYVYTVNISLPLIDETPAPPDNSPAPPTPTVTPEIPATTEPEPTPPDTTEETAEPSPTPET